MERADTNLKIIECLYDGIGDAVLYAWLAHSAKAAGIPCSINMRKHVEVAYMFGVTPDMTTFEPGERAFTDEGRGSKQTAFEIDHADSIGSRFAGWAKYLGLGDNLKPVRPPYVEHPVPAEWAEQRWKDRDLDTGSTRRVLLFPETYWASRQWPIGYFKDLGYMLQKSGCNVVTMLPTGTNRDGFPYYFHGMSLYHGAAMMKRADLVIGCDSGPAHIAGTIGVPTLAVCGPTRPEIVFGHLPSVRGVTTTKEKLPCIGCHFKKEVGFRHACSTGCRGLLTLTPEEVYEEAAQMLMAQTREPSVVDTVVV